MSDLILEYEIIIRTVSFSSIFLIMAVWEITTPCRTLKISKITRWLNNLSITILNTLLLRFLFPAAALGIASLSAEKGWGLFNQLDWPLSILVILTVILMDFAIYLQHVMFHAIPLLWRLHRVHHADPDFDVTTGARFHPIEIILSMFIKSCVIVLLGPPLVAVLIFEIVLNAMAMFNHSNIQLHQRIDLWLRSLIVTPNMHRVHHSQINDEANSNFGFNLTLWDRFFATYRDQPRKSPQLMDIGIREFSRPEHIVNLLGMLKLPFMSKQDSKPVILPSLETQDSDIK